MTVRYYVGTSGWHYDHWQGIFYPEGLPRTKWLGYYARHFDTVELNNTFYRLPSEDAFTAWYAATPPRFNFALKVSRFITHIKRLKDTEEAVGKFTGRAKLLREKLGPLLSQTPPNMHRDDARLESFLSSLPVGLRHVTEFRHESWLDDKVFEVMRRYNVALCIFDMPGMSCPTVATADFAYVRFHGSTWLYSSRYSDDELAEWSEKINHLSRGLKAVYAYFNNDAEGYAVDNARTLRRLLQTKSEGKEIEQPSL